MKKNDFAKIIIGLVKVIYNRIPDAIELELAYSILGSFDYEKLNGAAQKLIISRGSLDKNYIGALYSLCIGDIDNAVADMYDLAVDLISKYYFPDLHSSSLSVIKRKFEARYPGKFKFIVPFLDGIYRNPGDGAIRAQFRNRMKQQIENEAVAKIKQIEARNRSKIKAKN
ncbi:hypothetical protein D6827_04145 [Candidatus Parcubacteria bacterium]|nr:MAG: hypothetical protein D6827_04145 [Candidatus Parcubacteria bacterium]